MGIKTADDESEITLTRNAIIFSLRDFFRKARQLQGDGRPVKKLGQAMQVVLTAVSHAPELGAASLAAVADELDLGSHGRFKDSTRASLTCGQWERAEKVEVRWK